MARTYGGFVYRFTHLTKNSALADENWYYLRDTSACLFANGQIAMTVEDLNDKQFLLEDEEFEGPRMRFHKEGLEVDGVQIKTVGIDYIWPTELNSFMRICDQDTGEWYQYCVTTETMLRNTKMTARFEGQGVHYIQNRVLSVGTGRSWGTYVRLPYEQDGPAFSVAKGTLASPGFWVHNKGKQDITVNGNILTAEFVCMKSSYCTTAVGVPVVVEFSKAHALKMTIEAFTPPERILEGVTLQLQEREEMWASIQKMWASIRVLNESNILVCERSAHPVFLFCLQDTSHDWRRLQLVNTSLCAAFRQYKVQVEEYTATRELRKRCDVMTALCEDLCSMYTNAPGVIVFANNIARMPSSAIDDEYRPSFAWGLLVTAEAGPEVETPVIEVD